MDKPSATPETVAMPVAVHKDVSPDMLETFKALCMGFGGEFPLLLQPCEYHGQAATMLAAIAGPGRIAPLAVLVDPNDASAFQPITHNSVPVSTGQYL